jgi:hypothetical protein
MVITSTTIEDIALSSTFQIVIPIVSIEGIIPSVPLKMVITLATMNFITIGSTFECVIEYISF